MYKVSVIVPVYNGEHFLSSMLDTLVNQTLGSSLQIVVVDDGSEDSSLSIALTYKNDSRYQGRLVVVHTDNHGAAHARNVGLTYAEGEYVGFADCDDYVDLAMFEKLYLAAKRENAEIATCGYLRVDGFDVQRRDYLNRKCFGYNLYQSPSLLWRNVPYSVTKLFSMDLIRRENAAFDDDLRIYEDMLFSYKLFLKANKIIKVPECLYVYNYSREGSLTFEFTEKRFDLFCAFDRLVKFYKINNAFDMAQDELLRVFLLHVYVALEGRNGTLLPKGKRPIDFYSQAIIFLDRVFPWWRSFDTFFKRTKRPQFLYTNKLFLLYRVHRPSAFLVRDRRKKIAKRFSASVKPGVYFVKAMQEMPINSDSVIIDSQRGENLSGNMFYLLREMLTDSRYAGLKIGITYMKANHLESFTRLLDSHGLLSPKISFLKYNSKLYAEYLATARYIFTDTSMPTYFIKRPGQIYVNTWHGTPLKALGRDMNNGYKSIANITKNFTAADYLFFQNDFMNDCMKHAYMYEGGDSKTHLFGYPRNEVFFKADISRSMRIELHVRDRQAIAYLPTWRGRVRSDNSRPDVEGILDSIDALLDDSQVMFAKLHHYDATAINFSRYRHIRAFPEEFETYEVLCACDVLVTDYSSVMFDFAATKRKIILYAYDLDEYLGERGVYVSLDSLHLPIVKNAEQLAAELKIPVSSENADYLYKRFSKYDNAECSKKILNKVFSESDNNTAEMPYSLDTLIFGGSLIYPSSRRALNTLLSSEFSAKSSIGFAYDVDYLQNEYCLKSFNGAVKWRGAMKPFSAASMCERRILSLAQSDPIKLEKYSGIISNIMKREHERMLPHTIIKQSIVFGNESILWLLFAAMESAESILIIDDVNYYRSVPIWVLKQFDQIICPDVDMSCEIEIHGVAVSRYEDESDLRGLCPALFGEPIE